MTAKSVSTPTFRMNDGDWVCDDQNCQNVNFARRVNCNLCGKEKPNESKHSTNSKDESNEEKKRKLGHEIGKVAAEKSKGLFSADDWQCGRCGNVNWARRSTCNMCNAPKFGDNEERTGLGGGYNERDEHIEYIEREESDSEYDDFGRRKKKLKKTGNDDKDDSSNDSKHRSSNDKKQNNKYDKHKDHNNKQRKSNEEKDNEEEEEEEGDLSKYKLDSEDEEEDDDEEDLSKYDLSDWGTDKL